MLFRIIGSWERVNASPYQELTSSPSRINTDQHQNQLSLPSKLDVSLAAAAQMWHMSVLAGLNGDAVFEAHQRERDLRVPRRSLLLAPEVNLLPAVHHDGEVHQTPFILHAVQRGHLLEAHLFTALAFTVVQPESVLCQNATLLLPQLQKSTTPLLQIAILHDFTLVHSEWRTVWNQKLSLIRICDAFAAVFA